MKLRTLIVDDEPIARRGIRGRLACESDIEVIGECGDGVAAIDAIVESRPDLVFLDIQMPEVDGFDVVAAIGPERMPAVVFVTAFDHHALRAFDVHAVDYVLKPVDGDRFARALHRVRERLAQPLQQQAEAGRIAAALAELDRIATRRYAPRLAVRGDNRVRLVPVADIDWIQAAGNYVELHLGTRTLLMRSTLTELMARLDPEQFVRVSRSALVRIDRIRELQPMFNGDFVLILVDGTQIAGSRRHRRICELLDG